MKRHDADELRGYAEEGLCLKDIAEETGRSYDCVRFAAKRHGINVRAELCQTIRTRAEGMKPGEAVDYLLWQFDLLAEAMTGDAHHPVDDMGWDLTSAQRRLMICLYDANGSLRTRSQLHAAVLFNGPGRETQPEIVSVMVSHIRAKLPAEIGRIDTHRGVGYSLHLASQAPPA